MPRGKELSITEKAMIDSFRIEGKRYGYIANILNKECNCRLYHKEMYYRSILKSLNTVISRMESVLKLETADKEKRLLFARGNYDSFYPLMV